MAAQTLATSPTSAAGMLASPGQDRYDAQPESGHRPPDHPRTCMASLDSALTVVAADADFFRQFGRESADTCGRSLYELLHPSAPGVLGRHFAQLTEGRRARFAERMVGLRSSGALFSGELTGIAVQGENGQSPAFVVVIRPDEEFSAAANNEPQPRRKAILTDLDARILEGVASGSSTVQLAARLYLSRQGVEYHVGLMLRKLKVPNRAALVARAHSLGMLTVGCWPPRVLSEFVKDPEQSRRGRQLEEAAPARRAS
jgi:DNA-binding CsgD family transcriptional regulator